MHRQLLPDELNNEHVYVSVYGHVLFPEIVIYLFVYNTNKKLLLVISKYSKF